MWKCRLVRWMRNFILATMCTKLVTYLRFGAFDDCIQERFFLSQEPATAYHNRNASSSSSMLIQSPPRTTRYLLYDAVSVENSSCSVAKLYSHCSNAFFYGFMCKSGRLACFCGSIVTWHRRKVNECCDDSLLASWVLRCWADRRDIFFCLLEVLD